MSSLKLLPLAVFFALPGTFVTTYFISLALKHVYPLFPNISDIGSQEPESCVFSMLLNLTVATLLFVVYVRHKQISEFFRAKNLTNKMKYAAVVNLVATCFGVLSCIGMDIMANFQIGELEVVHDAGAYMCYWCSCIYIFLQTLLSFWMAPEMTSLWIVAVRGILGLLTTIFLLTNVISESFAEKDLKDFLGGYNRTDIVRWDHSQPGYTDHLTAGVAQWANVITLGTFILTYYIDFRRVTIYPPELIMVADPVPKPVEATSFRTLGTLS